MTREEEIKEAAFEYADKELIGIVDFKNRLLSLMEQSGLMLTPAG